MKTSDGMAIATVSLFEAGDLPFLFNPLGRGIFVCLFVQRRLKLAMASLYALFSNIHYKSDSRSVYEMNEA